MTAVKLMAGLGLSLVALAAAPAFASEPTPRAMPIAGGWGGIYIGISAGQASMSDPYFKFDSVATAQSLGGASDFIYGGHFGIQQQWGRLVLGLEAAYSGLRNNAERSAGPCANPFYACTLQLRNVLTLGPRLGWTPSEPWLLFLTGGYASVGMAAETIDSSIQLVEDHSSSRHDGWFIGGGLEWNIHANWVLGVEYQHIAIETVNLRTPNGYSIARDADLDVVRGRLSLKLGR